MARKHSLSRDRLRDIISAFPEGERTYRAVADEYRRRYGRQGRLGCSPNLIYEILKEKGGVYRQRVVRRSTQTPTSPFAETTRFDIDRLKPACFYCRFWRISLEDLESGKAVRLECRRAPPAADRQASRVWPSMSPLDWCGEFSDQGEVLVNFHMSHVGLLYFAGACIDPALQERISLHVRPLAFPDKASIEKIFASFSVDALRLIEHGCQRLKGFRPFKTLDTLREIVGRALAAKT